MKWILCAVDGSEQSHAAAERAVELAEKLGEGLVLLYVVEPPSLPAAAVPALATLVDDHATWAQNYLNDLAKELRRPGLEVSTQVVAGTPVDAIVHFASRPGIDMVVVGSHGRGMVARFLLGSVATRLSNACPKPLLIERGVTLDRAA